MASVEDRWDLAEDFPYDITFPGAALTAARAPARIIEGIPDAGLAAYELRAEAAMVQALQQVMDTIADRIAKAGPQ